METKPRHDFCQCCLTNKNLLIQVPAKTSSIVTSFSISFENGARICINCNRSFLYFDNFRQNCLTAQTILEYYEKGVEPVFGGTSDEAIGSAFVTIQNWLEEVRVLFEYQNIKVEDVVEESLHEEELFCESIEESELFKEEVVYDTKGKSQGVVVGCQNDKEKDVAEQSLHEEELFCERIDESDMVKEEVVNDTKGKSRKVVVGCQNDKEEDVAEESLHEEEMFCESIDESDLVKEEVEPVSGTRRKDQEVVVVEQINDDETPYIDDENLKQYLQESLQGTKHPYQCPQCGRCFNRGEFKYHLNDHNNVRPFKCGIDNCSSSFSHPSMRRYHVARYHQLQSKVEKRPYIRRSVKNQQHGEVEKGLVEDESKIEVICSVCEKKVQKKRFLNHFKIHSIEWCKLKCPYKDQGCRAKFRTRPFLMAHVQKVHDASYISELNPVDRICDICGKCFTKYDMKHHMNEHLNRKPLVCDFEGCTEAFTFPMSLLEHKRKNHLKIKRYRCSYCPKKIYSKEEYEKHKTENCGVKTVPCPICGKLINKGNLKCHLPIHKGERNYICPVEGCGKAFLLKNKLQQHSNTHNTVCKWVCVYCKSGFKCKKSLTRHLAKNHNERVVNKFVVI